MNIDSFRSIFKSPNLDVKAKQLYISIDDSNKIEARRARVLTAIKSTQGISAKELSLKTGINEQVCKSDILALELNGDIYLTHDLKRGQLARVML